jgi:hypothetical protein
MRNTVSRWPAMCWSNKAEMKKKKTLTRMKVKVKMVRVTMKKTTMIVTVNS